jgi:hypothetical protein
MVARDNTVTTDAPSTTSRSSSGAAQLGEIRGYESNERAGGKVEGLGDLSRLGGHHRHLPKVVWRQTTISSQAGRGAP